MKSSATRVAIVLGCLVFCACTAPSAPESAAMPANPPEEAVDVQPAPPAPEPTPTPAGNTENTVARAGTARSSVAGALRIGTRAVPALRICAMAVSGGGQHCTTTGAGATGYRIDDVPAGRYHLVGWARGGDVKLLAHADITRCVMPPCPPDELRVVDVGEGQAVTGIDLTAAYADTPEGWPSEPVD